MFWRTGRLDFWRALIVSLAIGLYGGLSGCGSVNVPLPDLAQKPSNILTPEERETAIKDMTRRQASHEQEAVEQIESQREI